MKVSFRAVSFNKKIVVLTFLVIGLLVTATGCQDNVRQTKTSAAPEAVKLPPETETISGKGHLTNTPAPRVSPTAATPLPVQVTQSPTSTLVPTATTTPIPTIKKTPIEEYGNVHAILSGYTFADQVAIDSDYAYYVVDNDHTKLYRAPLNGGERDVIATSEYEKGSLGVMPLIRTGDWLVFVDSPVAGIGSTWRVKAIDLRNMSINTLLDFESSSDPPNINGEGDMVVFTNNRHDEAKGCTENVLGLINIRSGEKTYLDKGCAEDRHMWVFAGISGDYVVADRYVPNTPYKGRASSDVFLINWKTGDMTQLTHNGRSSMPAISGDWVAWKASPRFKVGQTRIYNIKSRETHSILRPHFGNSLWSEPGFRAPLIADGRWIYWMAGEPLLVFDLETFSFLALTPPLDVEDGNYGQRYLSDSHIVWDEQRFGPPTESSTICWKEIVAP